MNYCAKNTLEEIDQFFSTFTRNPIAFKAEMISIFTESFENFKVEIYQTLKIKDKDRALFLIHRFKSSLRSIGVSLLINVNDELETELMKNDFSAKFKDTLNELTDCIELCIKELHQIK